ncbi:hypothetical protein C8R44DRAFT_771673 [Mycena epipterygia]|nr:hypothetical protein C8R44DRAFT_771673 [Mycena epipterygia]
MATAPDADGRTRQFLGDARGWVYSRSTTPSSSSSSVYDHNGDGNAGEGEDQWTPWAPEFCLHPNSEISAVCTAGARCVAVCFGPATKICVGDGGADGRAYLLSLTAVRDVRAASLQGRTLVLGAAQHAVLLSDIDASPVRTLDTHSDVFAVAQSDTLVYAGTRAGAAMRFDTRSGGGKRAAQVLFVNGNFGDSGHGPQMRSSVVFLQPTRGGQELVVGCMNGRVRFPFSFSSIYSPHIPGRRPPFRSFSFGHSLHVTFPLPAPHPNLSTRPYFPR